MRIVDASPSDIDRLADLAARTFPLACPPGSDESDIAAAIDAMLSPERFAEYVKDPHKVVRIAVDDDSFVGYAMFVSAAPTDPDVTAALTVVPSVEVSKLYVDPDAHGSGVAAALMNSGAKLTRELGRRAMWLGVNDQNIRARRFYEKSGFVVMGPKTFTLGTEVENDFVMQRLLD
ncbi:N-acetyltransferase [Rhodococcoides trifolii]|uniref:N-acetyltransferase n=1 Tax=Rhodococcoides trifolii TaxID=908250 RepID=A0A917D2X5_9NOCA|nr:GNAT family N-acetyltransferase [Rhodococcus trifolii]GGG08748.1 N-acetyltransferase [Rhodococcus trifolii]